MTFEQLDSGLLGNEVTGEGIIPDENANVSCIASV